MQAKCDEQTRQLADFGSLKNRLHGESGDLQRQLEEAESQLNALQRLKSQLSSQLEEARRTADEEARVFYSFKKLLIQSCKFSLLSGTSKLGCSN